MGTIGLEQLYTAGVERDSRQFDLGKLNRLHKFASVSLTANDRLQLLGRCSISQWPHLLLYITALSNIRQPIISFLLTLQQTPLFSLKHVLLMIPHR